MAAKNLELRQKISGSFNNANSQILIKSHWDTLEGKPPDYVPTPHSHTIANITNLQTELNDRIKYNDSAGHLNMLNNGIYNVGSLAREYEQHNRVNFALKAIEFRANGRDILVMDGGTTTSEIRLVNSVLVGNVVGSASQLGGQLPAYYAKATDLAKFVKNTDPIENFSPFSNRKLHDSLATNILAGKWKKLKVSINGTEDTNAARILTQQSYEDYSQVAGRAGDGPKVISVDLVSNGLYGSNGMTYAAGFVILSFYSSPKPTSWSARVKNKDGVWTAMTLTMSGNELRGDIPISTYICELEFTLYSGTAGPYVTQDIVWGLAEIAYYGTRIALSQGALVTSIGGYMGGKLYADGGIDINNQAVVVTNDARLTDTRNAKDVSAWAKKSSLAPTDIPYASDTTRGAVRIKVQNGIMTIYTSG